MGALQLAAWLYWLGMTPSISEARGRGVLQRVPLAGPCSNALDLGCLRFLFFVIWGGGGGGWEFHAKELLRKAPPPPPPHFLTHSGMAMVVEDPSRPRFKTRSPPCGELLRGDILRK